MGQVMKLWLSCYLVLLSIDSKPSNKTAAVPWPDPNNDFIWFSLSTYHTIWCLMVIKGSTLRLLPIKDDPCSNSQSCLGISHHTFDWQSLEVILSRYMDVHPKDHVYCFRFVVAHRLLTHILQDHFTGTGTNWYFVQDCSISISNALEIL